MPKTKIPWCDYTINPVKGLCPMACPYCYARAMYKRFKWNPEIRLDAPSAVEQLKHIPDGSRIFWGSTMELFGDWVKPEWREAIINTTKKLPNHTHIFLTKCPQNLPKEWPDNCWVGISTTGNDCRSGLEDIFAPIHAKVKFVSIEPLIDYTPMDFRWVKWVIIGCQTPVSEKTMCKREWVNEIIEAADKAKIPVFIKPPLSDIMNLHRQEFPK